MIYFSKLWKQPGLPCHKWERWLPVFALLSVNGDLCCNEEFEKALAEIHHDTTSPLWFEMLVQGELLPNNTEGLVRPCLDRWETVLLCPILPVRYLPCTSLSGQVRNCAIVPYTTSQIFAFCMITSAMIMVSDKDQNEVEWRKQKKSSCHNCSFALG